MSLFDQIGKKLTDAGQNVSQQTKNLTEVAKLTNSISEKKKKVDQLLQALGQAYYNSHKCDSSAEEFATISELNALFQEIEQCEESIKQIKGFGKCPSCGADVAPGSAFCNSCGGKIPASNAEEEATPEGMRTCPKCHAQVKAGNRFCSACGAAMEETAE